MAREGLARESQPREGECGHLAMVIVGGVPLCYLHAPVALRFGLERQTSARNKA